MAKVKVLSTPGCAGCDAAKPVIARVLREFPGVDWEEIDLTEFPELAEHYGIMSVPAIVIGDRLVFTGVPKEDDLRRKVRSFVEGA